MQSTCSYTRLVVVGGGEVLLASWRKHPPGLPLSGLKWGVVGMLSP